MKLELKHLAPYLPYNLKAMVGRIEKDVTLNQNYTNNYQVWFMILLGDAQVVAKPILRPLSDLSKEIEHNGEKFVPIDELQVHEPNEFVDFSKYTESDWLSFHWYADEKEKLHEWHFDVFGLIEERLAIDINTLKQ